ncbi:MAG TPA: clostripain-related cysteine peptidase [Caldilineaceae bacterium]|nr:clostripain-related cysteine peptidase [Caldilineaceae bacterium]
MLYQNADDPILEGDIFTDLNEAEWVGSTPAVTIVSQLDRYDGEFAGDGDWTGSKRFLVERDRDLTAIGSRELADLGEVDSGAPETLVDFAVWAMKNYPAKKYALILSDHGAGWVGGWNDSAPEEASSLTINEIDQALATILQETKVRQFEFLGFDACLMSEMEVLAGMAPYAHYAVASQETEPALGWAYAKFLGALTTKPAQSGAELAGNIVKSYIVNDMRIVDNAARTNYLAELGADAISAKAMAAQMSEDVTLTAIDLSKITPLMAALNEFAFALTTVDPVAVAKARTYAQSFESVFDPEEPSPYIDLGHFAKLVAEFAESAKVDDALKDLQKAYKAAILAEISGSQRPGASGFSIFFPTPDLLFSVGSEASELSYTGYASRFAGASLWDDFLLFHYTNLDIDPEAVALDLLDPKVGAAADLADYAAPLLADDGEITTPGVDTELSMTPLEVSSEEITANETVLLSTQIQGENVGYIYIEVTRYEQETEAYILEDMDFIASDDSEQTDGVVYPAWTNDDLDDFLYEWSPTIYSLSDGVDEAFALFEPEIYGEEQEDTEYVVRGIYTFADSEDKRYALMHFDGDLNYKYIFGYSDLDGTGAPREITPREGDYFTILEQRYVADDAGEWVISEQLGDTLTFYGTPFTVTAYEGYPGEYSLGIIVEDLLGNSIAEYSTVYVIEN